MYLIFNASPDLSMQVEKGKKGKKSWTPKRTMTTTRGSKARKGRRKVSLLPVQIDRRKGKEILPDPRKKKVSVNPPAAGPVAGSSHWSSSWIQWLYSSDWIQPQMRTTWPSSWHLPLDPVTGIQPLDPAAGPVTGTCGWTSDWKNLMYTLPLTFLSATTDTHFYNCS